MNAETLKSYGPCPKCALWHDRIRSCVRCLGNTPKARCARCGKESNCQVFGVQPVAICEVCLALIVAEWLIRLREYEGLAQS